MKIEKFISGRIASQGKSSSIFRNPLLRIAVAGIALGMAVMIISVLVVTGFRKQITDKVIGFGSHIQVFSYDNNYSYEESGISSDPEFLYALSEDQRIKSVNAYASKPGIIKTGDEIGGIVLKGVGKDYDWSFFSEKMITGPPELAKTGLEKDQIIISESVSRKLQIDQNSEVIVYFIEEPPRIRKFSVAGVYNTGLEEFDRIYAFCDIDVIRKLKNWDESQVGGFEITLKDPDDMEEATADIFNLAGLEFNTQNIKELYPQIFHWLDLQNINVVIILTLIILISGVSMISILLIIILDNTRTIGVLKALGGTNRMVRSIFIRVALPVILSGMILGNLFGLGLGYIQMKTGIISLPVESYYVSEVPVHFSLPMILALNAGTFICSIIMLIGPSTAAARISPASVLKLD